MKKSVLFETQIRRICVIALVAIIGFSLFGCPEPEDTSTSKTSPSVSNPGADTTDTDSSTPTPLTGTVSITGIAAVEQTLIANTDSLGGSGTISYQWKKGGTVIGTDNSYIIQSDDIGSTITVTVTRSGNSDSVTSAPTAVISAEPPPTQGLLFTKIGDAYQVSRGTATAAQVIIPTFYEELPVTTIAASGFSSYANMTSIRIPDRVTAIGQYAFYDCEKLISVTIPNSVTSIGQNAFTGCTGLTEITTPFFGAALNGNYPLGYLFGTTNYNGQNSYIPATLKTVIITRGNSIPTGAFYGCSNLTSITMPNSVSNIGDSAFYGCSGLTNITIPVNVTSIGTNVFSGCSGLKSITVDANNNNYASQDGILYNKSKTSIIFVPSAIEGSVSIPNGVTSITNETFKDRVGLTSITIPSSITSIGTNAFSGCTGLTEINYNATALADFTIGYLYSDTGQNANGITVNIGANVTKIPAYLFFSPKITSVNFASGSVCQSIGNYAFYGCTGLTSVTIPNNVTSIGNSAFYGCTGLTEINFNATALADFTNSNNVFFNAGQNANGITVNIGANVTKIPAYLFYSNSPKITSVNFASGSVCQSIGNYAFYYCTGLTSVTIPDSVTSIGYYAFPWSTLTAINVDAANTAYSSQDDVLYNKDKTTLIYYPGRKTTVSFTIPNSVTNIGTGAFSGCTNLNSVTIPNNVTSIGDNAFSDCTGLAEINFNATALADFTNSNNVFFNAGLNANGITVNIGANVTKIPAYLFYSYVSDAGYQSGLKITSVNFASGSVCQSIGRGAFGRCSGMTNITIPASVTSIGYNAFPGDLIKVIFQGTIPKSGFDTSAFGIYSSNLRDLFYASNSTDGTPGTYTRPDSDSFWTKS